MEGGKSRIWTRIFQGENKIRIIVALGLAGMVLVLISQFMSTGGTGKKEVDAATADFITEQYINDLEDKLQTMITGMQGVGRTEVMMTLEKGVEYVYVQEEKRNTDLTREEGEVQASAKVYEKQNVEQKYILIDRNGIKQPLLQTQLQPRVQGVVVACEGADDIYIQQNVTNVVTTALNIPSTRVCVVKIDTNLYSEREETQ